MSGKRRYRTREFAPLPTLAELATWERPTVKTPEQVFEARDEVRQLSHALEHLPAKYERIVRLRYGINCEPMTLDAIGEIFGLSRERIRQIEKTSTGWLIRPLIAKFGHRPGAQRIRRQWDERAKEVARQDAIMAARQAEDDMRSEAERHNAIIDAAARREREAKAEAERWVKRWSEDETRAEQARQRERRQGTVAEILRIAEEVELELDQIPRRPKQRVVNPFGFSAEKAAEYAAVLRGMMRA